jgi:hypothetical protein
MRPLRFGPTWKRKDRHIMKNWIKANAKRLWLMLAAVVLLASLGTLWLLSRPTATAGAKHITVTVVAEAAQRKDIAIDTDAAYLRQALESQALIAGEQSQYGLFVKTVDGVTADEGKQQWWCFTKGGQSLMTGVDDTPVADGDRFEITLTTGY